MSRLYTLLLSLHLLYPSARPSSRRGTTSSRLGLDASAWIILTRVVLCESGSHSLGMFQELVGAVLGACFLNVSGVVVRGTCVCAETIDVGARIL